MQGLCATLFLLSVFQKALPALPFSIFLGIMSYFMTRFAVVPYTAMLAVKDIAV